MNSLSVYDKVASGELTPDQAADELMRARAEAARSGETLRRPRWMPTWAFAVTVVLVALILSPFLPTRERR